jgi:shikimate kinase
MSGDPASAAARGKRDTIALLGPRCSGKTTVGRALAATLARPFIDLDEEVVRFGRYSGHAAGSAWELLARVGPAIFRDLEAAAVKRVLEPSPRCVLATGGGVVERADNRTWLDRSARCVYLHVPPAVLAERLRADSTPRPALDGGTDPSAELAAVAARREPLYRGLAELVIEAGAETPAALAMRIAAELAVLGAPS